MPLLQQLGDLDETELLETLQYFTFLIILIDSILLQDQSFLFWFWSIEVLYDHKAYFHEDQIWRRCFNSSCNMYTFWFTSVLAILLRKIINCCFNMISIWFFVMASLTFANSRLQTLSNYDNLDVVKSEPARLCFDVNIKPIHGSFGNLL